MRLVIAILWLVFVAGCAVGVSPKQQVIEAILNNDAKQFEKLIKEKPLKIDPGFSNFYSSGNSDTSMDTLHIDERLVEAAAKHCLGCIRVLHNSKVDLRKFDLINVAARHEHYQLIDTLFELGLERDSRNNTVLEKAISWWKPTTVKYIADNYPSQLGETKNGNGYTALHRTASGYQMADPQTIIEIAQILLEAGADLHAEYNNGVTPLQTAILADRVQMTNFLLNTAESSSDIQVDDISLQTLSEIFKIMRHSPSQKIQPNFDDVQAIKKQLEQGIAGKTNLLRSPELDNALGSSFRIPLLMMENKDPEAGGLWAAIVGNDEAIAESLFKKSKPGLYNTYLHSDCDKSYKVLTEKMRLRAADSCLKVVEIPSSNETTFGLMDDTIVGYVKSPRDGVYQLTTAVYTEAQDNIMHRILRGTNLLFHQGYVFGIFQYEQTVYTPAGKLTPEAFEKGSDFENNFQDVVDLIKSVKL